MPTNATVTLEEVWGEKVKARRLAIPGYSQRILAELSGTTQQTIWKIEHGKITPRDSLKIRIAHALTCPVSSLFPLDDA